MTAQRRLILETLITCGGHPTADQVYERAQLSDPTLNLSTVYRTLRWLEQEGFVLPRWFEDEHRQERFDPVTEDSSEEHEHFRCRVCNRIIEFSSPFLEQIKAEFSASTGGYVENATLVLYGICHECRSFKS